MFDPFQGRDVFLIIDPWAMPTAIKSQACGLNARVPAGTPSIAGDGATG